MKNEQSKILAEIALELIEESLPQSVLAPIDGAFDNLNELLRQEDTDLHKRTIFDNERNMGITLIEIPVDEDGDERVIYNLLSPGINGKPFMASVQIVINTNEEYVLNKFIRPMALGLLRNLANGEGIPPEFAKSLLEELEKRIDEEEEPAPPPIRRRRKKRGKRK